MTTTTERIAVIGGGIVGSTAAYYLARADYDVTLFDEGLGQATSAAAGIICPWLSLRRNKPWYYLVSRGAEFMHQLMHDLAQDSYETKHIYQVDGAVLIRNTEKRVQQDLAQAALKQLASPSMGEVIALTPEEITERFPLITSNKPAVWVSGGGRVHGSALVETLHQAIVGHGGKVRPEKARLTNDDSVISVETESHKAHYDKTLLANGAWLPEVLTPLGYSVDIRPQKGQLAVLQNDEWIDQHWPVVMAPGEGDIIPFNNGEMIIGATHENEQGYNLEENMTAVKQLIEEASIWMPSAANSTIKEIKVGTRAHTSDYSVLAGEVPDLPNVWAISGLGSSGLTSGPFLGYQWSQLIQEGSWDIKAQDFPIEQYIHKID